MLDIAQQRLLERRLRDASIIQIAKTAPHTRRPIAPLPLPPGGTPSRTQPRQLRPMSRAQCAGAEAVAPARRRIAGRAGRRRRDGGLLALAFTLVLALALRERRRYGRLVRVMREVLLRVLRRLQDLVAQRGAGVFGGGVARGGAQARCVCEGQEGVGVVFVVTFLVFVV